jgi:hypothetical protein
VDRAMRELIALNQARLALPNLWFAGASPKEKPQNSSLTSA